MHATSAAESPPGMRSGERARCGGAGLGGGAGKSRAAPLLSAAAAGRRLSFDQLEARVVGALHERDARALGVLDRPLEQRGAQPLEPRYVGLDVLRVEAEVLEAVVRVG